MKKVHKAEAHYELELTDTLGGEANYSWVRRNEITVAKNAADRTLIKLAKKWAGWTSQRCDVSNLGGDCFQIKPTGNNAPCMILFIQPKG